ncbi:MAG: hypothetical protein EOR52_11135 [Mesorhizobium sp.]|uniref:hypothetical protein n=1 Tax=Mesorhizobium sp. TaxID=1871066 RepID=UPI000FE5269C|nr:hypothetical protein [Mesorhizobium sp.]RWK89358.1 MAG: hypothetical protein EOR52_11135 [Mesorhizobium sp.]
MADFVGVLKKQLAKHSEPSPELRKRIYENAREMLAKKLANYSPPLSAEVISKQKRSLEDAVASVEREYAKPAPAPKPAPAEDPLAELEHIFSSIDRNKNQPSHVRQPSVAKPEPAKPEPFKPEPFKTAPAPAPVKAEPSWQGAAKTEPSWQGATKTEPGGWHKVPAAPPPMPSPREDDVGLPGMNAAEPDEDSDVFANDEQPADTFQRLRPAPRKRSYGGLIAAVVALLVLAGGGFGVWLNKDAFSSMLGLKGGSSQTVSTEPLVKPAPPTKPTAETAAAPAAGTTPPAAAATPPAAGTTPPPASGTAPATAQATVPVGQKAIFYEERTSTQQGTAEPGSIVWSLVQESPGGDLPPEPAIRAEATIRRNTDQTLPASHIIEMIFLTPEGFDGGGVDNILRIAMKSSEQDAGSPLIGIPAKIADGFFLVALNDTKADEDANLTLLRGQAWIDVPVVYKTGRRALLTMEKGIPGEKVFDEALKAWATKTSG